MVSCALKRLEREFVFFFPPLLLSSQTFENVEFQGRERGEDVNIFVQTQSPFPLNFSSYLEEKARHGPSFLSFSPNVHRKRLLDSL